MESGKIKTLFSDMERTEALFPRTKTSAVSNDDGRGLDALLENLPYFSSVDSSEAATVPMDADTLGGLPAENYATQSFVTNKIAEAQVGGSGGSGDIDLSGFATKDDINQVQTQLNSKADSSHTHNYLPITGGTLTGNIAIKKASPTMTLKVGDTSLETRIYKNASETADYGTVIADYDSNGKRDAIFLQRNSSLDKKLYLSVNNASGGNDIYYIYGEHNKPLPSEIGAFPVSGGTINGNVSVSGTLNVRGKQAFHYDTSTNAQTVGTNDATGGTILCCGSNAYVTVNGARLLTNAIVPRSGLTPNIGYADGRYNCIYLKTAANVSSDERLKRDIAELDNESLANFVDKLNVVSYNYNDDEENAEARIGLTAQNVLQADEDIAKFFVEQDDNGYYSLRPSDLVFPLIATVQKLTKEVEELKAKLG